MSEYKAHREKYRDLIIEAMCDIYDGGCYISAIGKEGIVPIASDEYTMDDYDDLDSAMSGAKEYIDYLEENMMEECGYNNMENERDGDYTEIKNRCSGCGRLIITRPGQGTVCPVCGQGELIRELEDDEDPNPDYREWDGYGSDEGHPANFGEYRPEDYEPVIEEDTVVGVERTRPDIMMGGMGAGTTDDEFDARQLETGIKVEMEHTKDPFIAKEISKDHLVEFENYYDFLKIMETLMKMGVSAEDLSVYLAEHGIDVDKEEFF